MSQPFQPGPDGELPDDIAAKLNDLGPEKPKRKRDTAGLTSLADYRINLAVFLLMCGAIFLFVFSLISESARPAPVYIVSTPLPLPTVTPGGVLDNLTLCTDVPVPQQGFMVLEVKIGSTGSDLIRANLAGEIQCRLTRSPLNEHNPAISPDGKTILYAEGESYNSNLRLMNVDGTDDREVSHFGAAPAWSPDGKQVIFPATVIRAADLMIGRLDGTLVDIQSPLADDVQKEFNDVSPDWSPDGKTIVFLSDRETAPQEQNNLELYVMNPDGTDLRRLTFNQAVDLTPVWLPDGRIAFMQLIPGEFAVEVFVIHADGSGLVQITASGGIKTGLAASPDGKYLYYTTLDDTLYRVLLDGTNTVQLLAEHLAAKSLDVWMPQ